MTDSSYRTTLAEEPPKVALVDALDEPVRKEVGSPPMPKVAAPGWYAVASSRRQLLNRLNDASFEIWYSFAYHYVRVTRENLPRFRELTFHEQTVRISDVEAARIVNSAIARAAVRRHPGSVIEGRFTERDVLDLLASQRSACVGCGTGIGGRYTIDHIVPRSRGGSNAVANIQLLCLSCNSSKLDRTMDEWLAATGRRPTIPVRPGAFTADHRFHEEAIALADWLYRVHDSVKALAFEALTIANKRFMPPADLVDLTVFPSLMQGAAECRVPATRRVMWHVELQPHPRFVWIKLLGRERDTTTRYCEQFRRGDPDLSSFRRAAGLDPAAPDDPPPAEWKLWYDPILAGGPVRSRLEAMPLRQPGDSHGWEIDCTHPLPVAYV